MKLENTNFPWAIPHSLPVQQSNQTLASKQGLISFHLMYKNSRYHWAACRF